MTNAYCVPGVAVPLGGPEARDMHPESHISYSCVHPKSCQLGGDIAGWHCPEGEMCSHKDVLRLCQASSGLGPGSDSVFAELTVGMDVCVAWSWYLAS